MSQPRQSPVVLCLKRVAPSLISVLRLALLPVIWVLWIRGHLTLALALYVIAAATDWVDGLLARRFEVASPMGGLIDVASDVIFLIGLLLLLGIHDVVSPWLFSVPLASAIVFFATSRRVAVRYDPVGKYFGAILYVLIGVILWKSSSAAVINIVGMVIFGLSLFIIANRLVYMARDGRNRSA